MKRIARILRKKQTPAEAVFWPYVRNRKLKNKKFLRQHPIRYYLNNKQHFFVADFYCHEAKLIIELDGKIHDKQKEYDKFREKILIASGYKIVRFCNEMVFNNITKVIENIKKHLL